jgi:hypothetical protein
MAEPTEKVVMRDQTGRLYQVAPERVAQVQRDQGWTLAGKAEVAQRVAKREQYGKYGSGMQQLQAAVETGLRTATFGAAPGFGDDADIAGRREVLREQSQVTSAVAQGLGAVLPAIATGGIATAGAGAVGLGVRGVAAASMLAEGAVGGAAEALEEAEGDWSKVKASDVLLYGVGGEIVGRAIPAVLKKAGRKAMGLGGGRATRGGEQLLAKAERKASEAAPDVAEGVPHGPDRDTFLVGSEKEIIDRSANKVAKGMDQLSKDFDEVMGVGVKPAKLKKIVAPTSEVQREWASGTSQSMLDLRARIRPDASTYKPARRAVPIDRDAYLATFREAADEIADELDDEIIESLAQSGVDAKVGSPSWRRAEQEVLLARVSGQKRATVPRIAPGEDAIDYRKVPGLGPVAKDLDRLLVEHSKRLDGAVEGHEWFTAADSFKRELAKRESKLVSITRGATPPPEAEDLLAMVRGMRSQVRKDLERTDLWGKAGEYQAGVNAAFHDEWIPGSQETSRALAQRMGKDFHTGLPKYRHNPASARSYLQADEVGRGLTPEHLKKQLAGAESAVATHRKYSTASESQLKRMEVTVREIREQIALADEVKGAKKRAFEREGIEKEAARREKERARGAKAPSADGASTFAEEAAEFAAETVLGPIPYAGRISRHLIRKFKKGRAARAALAAEEAAASTPGTRAARGLSQDDIRRAADDAFRAPDSASLGAKPDAQPRSAGQRGSAELGALGAATVAGGAALAAPAVAEGLSKDEQKELRKAARTATVIENLRRSRDAAIGMAARGAVRGSRRRQALGVERMAEREAGVDVALTDHAASRFQGDYPSPRAAFEARKRILEQLRQDPMALHEALASSFGMLPDLGPELFGEVAGRVQVATQYLQNNLPAQLAISVVRPNGIPLSRATMRDFMLKWNSVTDPYSVLEDVRDGIASPTQIAALRATDPDTYERLKVRMIQEIAETPEQIPIQRKVRFDTLFGADGTAGRAYSWSFARSMKEAAQARKQSAGPPPGIAGKTGSKPAQGLRNIQSSVTNSG